MFFSEAIFFANGEAIIRSPSLLVVVGEGLGGALMPASSCDDAGVVSGVGSSCEPSPPSCEFSDG